MRVHPSLLTAVLACLGALAACDQTAEPPAAGRYVSAPVSIGFDVPFAGDACGRTYSDARRLTTGRLSGLELTVSETGAGLAGLSLVEYDYMTVVRQAGLPECPFGGLSAGGYDSVAVTRQGTRLLTDQLAFAERAEFEVTEGGLSGVLVIGDSRDSPDFGFGAPPDLPVTLRRVPAGARR